jgi:predicted RNA-binding Zn ribbon-like protein
LAAPDLARLRALRSGLRGAIDAPHGTAARRLAGLARDARLGVAVGPEGVRVVPGATGADAVVGRLLLDAVDATGRGAWTRIRVCAGPGCDRVFMDITRGRNRAWCDMATCGNRAKVRAHRVRAREARA